jgi:hypothetical protein
MDYFVLTELDDDGGIIDSLPDGAPDRFRFRNGELLAPEFPKGAWLRFTKNFPDLRALKDFQPNTLRLVIVSPRARAVIDSFSPGNLEYLPVDIRDHGNNVVGPGHAILNPLGTVPAIDLPRSEVRMDVFFPDRIDRVYKLALDRNAIPEDAVIFRCARKGTLILVRQDLKEAIEKAGLTGCRLDPAEGWEED